MTPTGGGQQSLWAKAGELLLMKQNHAGATVRMTGPKTGLAYKDGCLYLFRFARKGKDRRPDWHLEAKSNIVGRLQFRSKRAIRNYETLMPQVDPADIDLFEAAFKQHVTLTREYRRTAKDEELAHRGTAFSRGAAWVRRHKGVTQNHCMLFPGAVCYSPASVTYNYQSMAAARAMCLEAHGRPDDPEHVVRHKCGMGHMSCVNPAHLAWGANSDNGRDMSLHRRKIYNPDDYPTGDVAAVKNDPRLTNVIAWELGIPSALVSAIKLATA